MPSSTFTSWCVCVCVRVGARSEILVYKKNKRNGKWHNCFNSPENVRWFGETMPKKTVATATTGQINVIDVVISEPVLTGIHLKVTIFVFVLKLGISRLFLFYPFFLSTIFTFLFHFQRENKHIYCCNYFQPEKSFTGKFSRELNFDNFTQCINGNVISSSFPSFCSSSIKKKKTFLESATFRQLTRQKQLERRAFWMRITIRIGALTQTEISCLQTLQRRAKSKWFLGK